MLDQVRDSLAGNFGKDDQGVADSAAADFCDVGKLFTRLVGSLDVSSTLQTAAQSVLTAYSSTIVQNYSAIPSRTTGLSIYFSDRGTSPMPDYISGSDSFLVNTQWDEFLNGWLWY